MASVAHFVTWLVELSIQTRFPLAVGRPVIVRIESVSVWNVISLVLWGVNETPPVVTERSPPTVNELFTVVVPVVAVLAAGERPLQN